MVKLYSKNGCPQCHMTKILLDKNNIDYVEININEQPEFLSELKEKGFKSMPVVEALTETWTGFRPDKIQSLLAVRDAV